ncbi:hypothetical protein [Burkholderia sp. NRF60-BP8]|uniref:hypothetical protein n=1 Tax=Burkholderia sp. NRF60-BP8 TaxID=1637853 RepID=UPI000AAFE7F6|nr:hypothetical protein [Burkholderia sp. NRF60-BP8]
MKITDDMLTDERLIELAIFHKILGIDGNGDATRSYGGRDDVLNLCRAVASAARRTTPDRESIIEECAKVGEHDQAGPKTLDQIWDAAMDNAPSSVCTYRSAPSNVVSILDKVPSVFYGVSIEQGPDGVRSVRVHDVDDTPRDREAVAFALREAADIISPLTASPTDSDWDARRKVAEALGIVWPGTRDGKRIGYAWSYLLACIRTAPTSDKGGA